MPLSKCEIISKPLEPDLIPDIRINFRVLTINAESRDKAKKNYMRYEYTQRRRLLEY